MTPWPQVVDHVSRRTRQSGLLHIWGVVGTDPIWLDRFRRRYLRQREVRIRAGR